MRSNSARVSRSPLFKGLRGRLFLSRRSRRRAFDCRYCHGSPPCPISSASRCPHYTRSKWPDSICPLAVHDRVAAIYDQGGAGDELGRVGGQENRRPRQVIGCAQSPLRCLVSDLLAQRTVPTIQVQPFSHRARGRQQVVRDRQVCRSCEIYLASLPLRSSAAQNALCSCEASPCCSVSKTRDRSPARSASGSSHRPGKRSLFSTPTSSACCSS